MKNGKAYRIFMTIIGSLLVIMGLLLLIVSPISGIFGIAFGIFIIVIGRKVGKQPPQTQEVPAMTLEELVKKYPPQDSGKARAKVKAIPDVGEKHRVAGTSFRQEEIASLGEPNDEYDYTKNELIDCGLVDEKIYEMTFSPQNVQLTEEPEGSEYAGAVQVVIDGVHVGYIKSGSASHVKKLLQSGTIKKVTAEIEGGKFKIIESEYDDETGKETYTLTKDKTDYFVTIRIIT